MFTAMVAVGQAVNSITTGETALATGLKANRKGILRQKITLRQIVCQMGWLRGA